jgi:hypothetical protein
VLVRATGLGRERLQAATERVRAVERTALAGLSAGDELVIRSWLAAVASGPIER